MPPSTQPKRRFRNILLNALLLAVSLLVAFGISEALLYLHEQRVLHSERLTHLLDGPTPDDLNLHQRSENEVLVYELRPNAEFPPHLRINSAGFRDEEFSTPKPEDVYRIICLGDSVTFGWETVQDNTWPAILEEVLASGAEPPRRYEVYNMAVGGYNAEQECELLRTRVWDYDPDLVLVGYCINDGQVGADAALWQHYTVGGPRTWKFIQLCAVRVYNEFAAVSMFERAYSQMNTLCKDRNIPLGVAFFAHPDKLAEYPVRDHYQYCQDLGLPVFSMGQPLFRFPEDQVTTDNVHLTAFGSIIAAEEVARGLRTAFPGAFPGLAFDTLANRERYSAGLRALEAEDFPKAVWQFEQVDAPYRAYMRNATREVVDFVFAHRTGGAIRQTAQLCRDIVEQYPESALAHIALGQCIMAYQPAKALAALERALELDPRNQHAAKIAHQATRLVEENRAAAEMAAVFEEQWRAKTGDELAGLAREQDYARLAELAAGAVERFPNSEKFAHYLARALRYQGKLEAACDAAKEALKRFPDAYRIWLELADAQKALGNLEAAERGYANAARHAKLDPTPHSAWGALLVELGRYEEAVPVLQEALNQRVSGDSGARDRFALIRAYRAVGNGKAAQRQIAQCRELGLDVPDELMAPAAGE